MWLDAILAYLHYTAVFVLFAFLTVEVMISRAALDARAVAMLARVDLWYVGATVAALVTGFARALWGAKGWAFYSGDWVFHAKVTLFLVVAGLAIAPALAILRWNRRAAADPGFAVPEDERRKLRRWLMGEVHAAALIPVLAVMMARGLGR